MGVRMRWVGSRPRMWRSVIKEFDIAEQMTVGNDVITINYCVNYGGRTEIVEAARELAQDAADGKINPGGSARRRSPSICTAPTSPTSTCSSAPRGAAREQLPAVAGRVRRIRLPGQAVAGLRPPRSVGGVHGIREPQPPILADAEMTLQERLAAVLDDILPIEREDDGALTVHHDETFASLRVVTIAEGLDMVSLTQILAWDLPMDSQDSQQGRQARTRHPAGHGVAGGEERWRQAQLEEGRRRSAALQLSCRRPD